MPHGRCALGSSKAGPSETCGILRHGRKALLASIPSFMPERFFRIIRANTPETIDPMPYPVHFVTTQAEQLLLLGRQRAPADQLLYLMSGSLLLRLGKEEMVLRQGDSFWLPAECLHGLTLLQGCRLVCVRFSVRVRQRRPQSAGHLLALPLLPPLLSRLDGFQQLAQPLEWQGASGRLLRVIADLLPELRLTPYSPLPWPAAVTSALKAIMQGQELSQLVNHCQSEHGGSPRALLDLFLQHMGSPLIDWQEQWQLYQTHLRLKQGQSEEQAYRQAGFASQEQYLQSHQRYLVS